jgi:hypothetical protein
MYVCMYVCQIHIYISYFINLNWVAKKRYFKICSDPLQVLDDQHLSEHFHVTTGCNDLVSNVSVCKGCTNFHTVDHCYIYYSRDISVKILTRVRGGRPRFDSRQGLGIFLLVPTSTPALGPTQPPFQLVPGALSPAVKRPGHEVDHLPPSSVEIKNAWSYTSTPVRLYGVVLS